MQRKSTVHKKILVFLLFVFIPLGLFAGEYDLNVIDTPKAAAAYKGDMKFGFSIYDGGGILTSAILAISDYAFLGVYFDADHVIGSETPRLNQPGVIARFLVSDGSTSLPPIAIGYSYFMTGNMGKVDGSIVNGFYVVASQGFYLLGMEQGFSYGFRYPVIPLEYSDPENLTVFLGTDVQVSPEFSLKGEIENIHFARERWPENYYNFGANFNIVDLISISLDFKYTPLTKRMIRNLTIGYFTQF